MSNSNTRFRLGNDGIVHATTGEHVKPGLEWESTLPPLALKFDSAMLAAGTRRATIEGQRLPPWYYGLAYEDVYRDTCVFYLFPLHLVVRALRWISFWWARARSTPSWFDQELRRMRHEHHGWVRHGYRTPEEDADLAKVLRIPLNPGGRSELLRRMRVVDFGEGPTARVELLEGPDTGQTIVVPKTKIVIS